MPCVAGVWYRSDYDLRQHNTRASVGETNANNIGLNNHFDKIAITTVHHITCRSLLAYWWWHCICHVSDCQILYKNHEEE